MIANGPPRKPSSSLTKSRPAARTKAGRLRTVNLNNKADVNAWAMALEDVIDDMAAAADEATLHKSVRVLSRSEARRRIFAAWDTTHHLLGALLRGAR